MVRKAEMMRLGPKNTPKVEEKDGLIPRLGASSKRVILTFALTSVLVLGISCLFNGPDGVGLDRRGAQTEPPSPSQIQTAASSDRGDGTANDNQQVAWEGAEWQRVMGSPLPTRLFAVTIVSDTLGWALGDEGTILRYDGSSWETTASPSTYRLYDLVMTTVSSGWAVGDYGTVLRFDDGRWTVWPQKIPNTNLHAIAMPGPDSGWAVGRAGTILAFDGERWKAMDSSPTTFPLHDVVSISPTAAFAVGGGGTILALHGDTWGLEPSPTQHTLKAIAMSSPDAGWAVGEGGTILQYDGIGWTCVDSPVDDPLHALAIVAPDDVWAAGQAGLLVHYDGTSWTRVIGPTAYSLYGLAQGSDGDIWAVGFGGTVLRYTDEEWKSATRLNSTTLRDLLWQSNGGWAVGDGGEIWHSDGESWLAADSSTSATLYAIDQASPGDLWTVGERGTILHHKSTGWVTATSPTTLTLRGLTFTGIADGWAVGGDQRRAMGWSAGVLLHYDGVAWQAEPVQPGEPLHALAFVGPDLGWAVGEGGAIWRYDGDTWSPENFPTDYALWSVAAVGASDVWAVGETGVILHYDGDTWRAETSPTSRGLHKLIMTNPREGWALGDSGTLLHYDGLAWRVVQGPTAYRLLGGGFDDRSGLWAVGDGGTLLLRRSSSGYFRVTVSPAHVFATRASATLITVTASAVDGFHLPITMSIGAPLDVLSTTWSETSLTPSVQVALGISLSMDLPTTEMDTCSVTISAVGGGLRETTDVTITVLPGEWSSGVNLASGGRIHDLSYDGEDATWVVGDDGVIWRYNTAQWRRYRSNTTEDLYAVEALSPTLAWCVGARGTILRYDGTSWLTSASLTTMPLFGLTFRAPNNGWAVGGGGTFLHYDGLEWDRVSTPGEDWLYDVDMTADGTGWAVGWGGAIWRYDGAAWRAVDSPSAHWLRAVSIIGPEEAWAVGSEGTILHYAAGRWRLFPSPTAARLLDVHFNAPDEGWATGGDGTVLYYDGSAWHVVPSPVSVDLRALDAIDLGYGFALGHEGSVICYHGLGAKVSSRPGCGGVPISQGSDWSHQLSLPMVALGSGGRGIDHFGVQTMGGTFSRDPDVVHRMAEAGIRWARIPFSWKLIEPSNTTPDEFHWSVYDDWFELLSTHGIRPQPFLARNPSWAGVLPASYINRSDVREQREFVQAAVDRYSRPPYNVSHWEMYNEPDNNTLRSAEIGWGLWGDDAGGYAEQLATLYPDVKEAYPQSKVLLGGVAHDYFAEDGGSFVRSFITDVLSAGGGTYLDLMNFHYYGPDLTDRIEYFNGMLTTSGLDKPIACTEVGKALGDPALEDEGELYARYVPKVMIRGLAGALPIVDWFALGDMEGTWRPGLFALDRTTRPAYEAYRVLTTQLRDATYLRPLSEAEMNGAALEGYAFQVPTGTGRLDVVWTAGDETDEWHVSSPSVRLTSKYGDHRSVYDVDDGRRDGLTALQVGADPLYVLQTDPASPPVGQSLAVSIWPAKEITSQVDAVHDAGANWVRVNVYWDDIEPVETDPRTYEWDVTDRRILSVTEAGVRPIVLLGGNPAWASQYPGGPVTDTQDITDFLAAAAERYDGDGIRDAPGSPVVQVWELYNEPDNQDPNTIGYRGYGSWGGMGAQYAELLKLAREALRSANPTAEVAIGGLAHEELDHPAFDLGLPDALFGYIRDHPGDYFDYFNFHFFPWFGEAYSSWGPGIIGKTAYFRDWMDRYELRWPIIVTEAGHVSSSTSETPSIAGYEQQASYVLKLFSRSAAADIKATVWLLVTDIDTEAYGRHGLTANDGTPKPAYNAYQTVADKLGDLHFDRPLSSSALGATSAEGYAFRSTDGLRHAYVVWTNEPGERGTLRISARSALVSDKVSSQWPMNPTIPTFGPYTVLDGDDGGADGITSVEFGNGPIYVELGS